MQARPLFRDRRKFPKMADPKLQGHYPMRGLYQALAVAAMCLQEQAVTRPLIGDVVTALTYLASQTYDPSAAASQSNRVGSSTPRAREDWKNISVGFDNQHAIQSPHWHSPDFRHRGIFRGPSLGDGGRGDVVGQYGINLDLDKLQTQESQTDSAIHLGKAREAPGISNRDLDRERAVAEAKVWGENWRERKKMKEPISFDGTSE